MDTVKIADIVVTAAVAVVGFYLAHSFRRQIALRVAEQRLAAYATLWSKMGIATPQRDVERWGLIFTFDNAGRSVKLWGYGEALASGI